MRNLKKHRDATPFIHPVDYIKLKVPDYPQIIKHPIDLTTIDGKLQHGEYSDVDQFVADIRLLFNNCYKFNGPEAMVSMLCQNVESAFEKSLRQMPPSKEVNIYIVDCGVKRSGCSFFFPNALDRFDIGRERRLTFKPPFTTRITIRDNKFPSYQRRQSTQT
jgi:hypothetical protein